MNITDPITTIATHDNCNDGLGSALILKQVYPEAEVAFLQHNTEAWRSLEPRAGVLFCDMTPPPQRAAEWAAAGAYCLDHHIHARETVEAFGTRGLFDNDACGTMLAYREVMKPRIPDPTANPAWSWVAHLIDVRDRWVSDSPDWGRAQQFHHLISNVRPSVWLKRPLDVLEIAGPLSVSYRTDENANWLDYSWLLMESEMVRAEETLARFQTGKMYDHRYAVGIAHGSLSSQIGEQGRQAGFDVTCVIVLAEDMRWVFSMRSSDRVDVGAIAKANGGGGHARAAGFSLPFALPDGEDPFVTFEHALATHLEDRR